MFPTCPFSSFLDSGVDHTVAVVSAQTDRICKRYPSQRLALYGALCRAFETAGALALDMMTARQARQARQRTAKAQQAGAGAAGSAAGELEAHSGWGIRRNSVIVTRLHAVRVAAKL